MTSKDIESSGDLRLWSRKMIAELIERYKSHPCLWNMRREEYKNKYIKAAAYKSLVEFCKTQGFPEATKDFVKRKIQSLRGSFRKERRKARQSARTGKTYHSNLWYYNQLMFTQVQGSEDGDLDEERNQSEGDDNTYQSNEEVFEVPEDDEEKYLVQLKPSANAVIVSSHEDTSASPHTTKRLRLTEDCIQPEFLDIGQEIPKFKELSEFELTGMNVAKKLARMDTTQAIYAESIINNVIRKGLLRKLTEVTDICDYACDKRILAGSNLPTQSTNSNEECGDLGFSRASSK